MVFGSIVNECYVNSQGPELLCIFNENESACSYGIAVGVIAFFGCIFFFVVDLYFQQISSVKDRKRAVLLDLGFSGTSLALLRSGGTKLLQGQRVVAPRSSPPVSSRGSRAWAGDSRGGRCVVPSSRELRGSSEEAGAWRLGDSEVSRSSVSLLQPEPLAELGLVRPPRELRVGGGVSESRQGVSPARGSCRWLEPISFHQLHLGPFLLCACVFWNEAETHLSAALQSRAASRAVLGAPGLPGAHTDFLCHPQPLDLRLIPANWSGRSCRPWLHRELPAWVCSSCSPFQAPALAKAEGDLSSASVAGGSLVPNENIHHRLPALACF